MPLPFAAPIRQVDVGASLCVLFVDGSVACASVVSFASPDDWYPVDGIEDALLVSGPCALRSNGRVACWGGYTEEPATYVGVADAVDLAAISFGNGERMCVARSGDKRVLCKSGWIGPENWRRIAGTRGAIDVAIGREFGCARWTNGDVACWTAAGSVAPVMPAARGRVAHRVPGLHDAVAIDAQDETVCAVRADRSVVCWGKNYDFRLGSTEDLDRVATPRRVAGLPPMRSLSVGEAHVVAISRSNEPYGWGTNQTKSLADGRVRRLRGAGDVRVLKAGHGVCVQREHGDLVCEGSGSWLFSQGELERFGAPVDAVFDLNGAWGCSGRLAGGVLCSDFTPWGAEEVVGVGTSSPQFEQRLAPTRRRTIAGPRLSAVTTGPRRGCGLDSDGSVYCWSREPNPAAALTRVPWLEPAVSVATDDETICAANTAGGVQCTDMVISWPIPEVTDVQQVVMGAAHTCVRTRRGQVACWGANSSGQLGQGGADRYVHGPKLIQALGDRDIVAVDAGGATTCVLDRRGAVWCWGDNAERQAGVWSPSRTHIPQPVLAARIRTVPPLPPI